ncbi:MAG: DUF3048 domain-containing protein [Bacilli bacterium]
MKKKKLKKSVLVVLGVILVIGASAFILFKTGMFDKFKINNGGSIFHPVVKKLQIIDEKSKSRVVAVMINNHHEAWPHAGLQDSFLNYEIIAEGGISRIMALYKDKDPKKIGSVRSARHYFLDYVMESDATYVHFGWSPQAQGDIKKFGIDNINGIFDSKGFWRDETLDRDYEHTAFASMEKLKSVISSKGYRTTSDKKNLLNYTTDTVDLSKREDAIKADTVKVNYSTYQSSEYTYDKTNSVYLRSMCGKAHTDIDTNKQYTTKNIIAYDVKNYSIDSYGRQTLENIGSGNGYYITNGYAVPITWEKTSREAQTVYKYQSDQKEIDISDGNTWIQIYPKGKVIDIEASVEQTPQEEAK